MGADLILFNYYDVTAPQVTGFPDQGEASPGMPIFRHMYWGHGVTMAQVKEWIGRPVGLNLEPVENLEALTTGGRLASPENAQAAVEQGADFIVLTGNLYTDVTTAGIARALVAIREPTSGGADDALTTQSAQIIGHPVGRVVLQSTLRSLC